MEPVASRSSYPNFSIGGRATFDMVATVARLEPQTALKPPQATMVAMASPPRRCPSQACDVSYRSCEIPERATKLPVRMKSGRTEKS